MLLPTHVPILYTQYEIIKIRNFNYTFLTDLNYKVIFYILKTFYT